MFYRKWSLCFLLGMLLQGIGANAQVRISSEEELQLLRETPMEALYVHTTATILFPGEYLYYSLYCINTQTYRLSNISEIAYIQLINEENNIISNQKILLKGGRGQGDIFLGTNLPSGNYKLVAFTHWMKNAGPGQFYLQDISFINPYLSGQGNILSTTGEQTVDSVTNKNRVISQKPELESSDLAIQLKSTDLTPKEEAVVTIRNFKGKLGYGSYSLSIRKRDQLPHALPVRASQFAETYASLQKQIPQNVNSIVSIPEQRGELISGRVTDRAGVPLSSLGIAISLPGEDFQIKTAQTDREGQFYTYITKPFKRERLIVEVMDPENKEVTIELDKPYEWDPDLREFYQLEIGQGQADIIRKRSVHNQIENSYFELKPDTVLTAGSSDPFDGEIPETYDLDDYTRFPTLRETIIEIIAHVDLKRNASGETTFWVQPPQENGNDQISTDPPLVTIDGVLVQDLPEILRYDARQLKYIHVLRDPYVMGSSQYQGMVAIETINGDYAANYTPKAGNIFPYTPPRPVKNYFRQASANLPGHIPDFRTVLLWLPKIEINSPQADYTFKTSQVKGTYEIRLEGFTSFGKPISLLRTIRVE